MELHSIYFPLNGIFDVMQFLLRTIINNAVSLFVLLATIRCKRTGYNRNNYVIAAQYNMYMLSDETRPTKLFIALVGGSRLSTPI